MVNNFYSSRDLITWSVIAAIVGLLLGYAFNVNYRGYIFLVITSVGSIWLVALGLITKPEVSEAGEKPLLIESQIQSVQPMQSTVGERILSPDEAREWLDDFLKKQQKS
jgi:hypothetical protein